MAKVVAGQTVSVDGFVADREGDAGPLYRDLAELRDSSYMTDLVARTGAVVMGRRSYEMPDDPDSIADSYEFQVPIFVLTHRPPAVHPKENDRLRITFVGDGPESAVRQAQAAAGGREVTVVGGVDVITQLLRAGLVDELHVEVVPVLLGEGRRFLGDPALAGVRLQTLGVREFGPRTLLRFGVLRGDAS